MKCACCDSTEIDKEKFSPLLFCENCFYAWQSKPEKIEYDDAYVAKYEQYDEAALSKIRLEFLKTTYDFKGARVLDFGCGTGNFVRAARAHGYDAYGFDAVKKFIGKHYAKPKSKKWHVITAFDSFEHLTREEQIEFLKLSPDYFIFSVPNFEIVLNKIETLEKWRHYKPNEHLHYYCLTSLTEKMEKYNYVLSHFCYDEDKIRKANFKRNILTAIFEKK